MNPRQLRQKRASDRLTARAGVTMSRHASSRAHEFGFSTTEVLECVALPEQTYDSHPAHGPRRRTYQRHNVAVVVDVSARVVVTVLPRITETWRHGEVVRNQMLCHLGGQ